MNLKQLQYFIVVAQERQLTSAAKLLYIAQPPLSYQMKQLEKELGTKLFTREAHGITLTEAGKIFYRYAQQVVNLTKATNEELANEKKGVSGTIRMGLISSAGNIIPNEKITGLTAFYPHIKFEIIEDNTLGLIDKLKSNLVDFAIVRTPFNMQGLAKKDLATDEMAAVYNHHKFKFKQENFSINDFTDQPLILYRRFESIFNDTFAQHGITPYYAVKCDDARTAILWADCGMGIALVPLSIAKQYANQTVKAVNYAPWHSKVQLVWPKKAHRKAVTQHFIDLL
ncbi:LysR family transcriptional regulator [Limosilactobacillus sp. STM2_1]|uniref:LysR family transcriptional regulator n=1 Tax=Limosilactobacillus rudii TaxID=2759755 RepID=A0A7W3UM73_9LACO|nr:LysR family transcriptional regulator [Limosilactobacillus rudii]MBB1079991.1 LysR family transcriptional regulator [Limosilactobacillus rudii]MBB1098124.1 LysR family transcriptional regulator [Limosilactobacillus rudii]MCD7135194.1 LysR family transcriptional regulator [Limosilactobacillus rudii]